MKRSSVRISLLTILLGCTVFALVSAAGQGWPQWAGDQQHSGTTNVVGQNLNNILVNIVYDPFVELEKNDPDNNGTDLNVIYQTPLVDGNDVYMEFKTGFYVSKRTWETQIWNERKLSWVGNNLVEVWNFETDWKPVPNGDPLFRQPVFHAALAGDFVYVPGAGGTVFKVRKSDGSVAKRFNPFDENGEIVRNIFVTGPLTADSAGNIYYNAMKLNKRDPWFADVINAWLVKISPNDQITFATFKQLATGEQAGTDPCEIGFAEEPPLPPSPTAIPPTFPCGSIRPGVNVAPAIGPDGTIYTVARNHFVTRYGYIVAVNPDFTPKWTASTKSVLNDGCNVLIPPNGTPGGCSVGAPTGVDPDTNTPPSGRVNDNSSATPVVAPDGTILYGSQTRYNYAQGHLLQYSPTGQFLRSYPFGWDITPAIYKHNGTYSIILKENRYNVSSYCNDDAVCPPDRNASNPGFGEAYFITRLSPTLQVEWQYKNTNTLACTRNENGSVTCVDDHPFSFEWCVNAPAIDANGVIYVNNEDGNLYAINPDGTLKQRIFQQLALRAAYTPASIGPDGKIYSQQNGRLIVIGN